MCWSHFLCVDVDECSEVPSVCVDNADCTDTDGSFECACRTGYSGDGRSNCSGEEQGYSVLVVLVNGAPLSRH